MRESESTTVVSLLEERRKLRDRLRWAGDPDLVKVVLNGQHWLDKSNLTEHEHELAMSAAKGFYQRQLDANTEYLGQLGIKIEEDAE